MRRTFIRPLTFGLVGGALLAVSSALPTMAGTLPASAAVQIQSVLGESLVVEHVAHRRYDPHRHGPRFKYRRDRYRYYHGGWYYAYPWWLYPVPPVIVVPPALPPAYRSAHVRWCLEHYRSYDVRSDTFLGFDGVRRRCRSPYRP